MRESDLKYFKDVLLERKKQILSNIETVEKELEGIAEFESKDEGDFASCNNSSLIEDALSKQQKNELEEIEAALKKINTGEYGECDMCGDPITFQRLKVKPHAKYCINCRELIEKENKKG